MAPLAAIFIADYYVAKQKRIDVAALYMGENGRYWYKGGWNVAGVIAWILAFIIPLAGNTVMKYDPANGDPNFLDYLAAKRICGILCHRFLRLSCAHEVFPRRKLLLG